MNQQDTLKFERYKSILAHCKTVKVIDDFDKFSTYSIETMRADLKVLTEVGLLVRNYINHGKYNHKMATFTALKDTFTLDDYANCKQVTSVMYMRNSTKIKKEIKSPRPRSSVIGNVTTFNIDDYADKVNDTARMHRTHKHTGIGSSFGLVGW